MASAKTPEPELDALDRALGRAAMVAYLLLVLVMLSAFMPGVRRRALEWLRVQLWLLELGRHDISQDRARSIYRRLMDTAPAHVQTEGP